MTLTWVQRASVIAVGLLVTIVGLVAWAVEGEFGGGSAVEHYHTGHLVDGSAEVREIRGTWHGDYEVEALAGDRYAIRWFDVPSNGKAVVTTGSAPEITAWLEAQGAVVFTGSEQDTVAWLDARREEARDHITPGVIIAFGVILVIGGLTNKGEPRPQSTVASPAAHRPQLGVG